MAAADVFAAGKCYVDGSDARPLYGVIAESLNHHMYDNASFLAERLDAHEETCRSVRMLATCHMRAGHPSRALSVIKQRYGGAIAESLSSMPADTRYLAAQCCFRIGKIREAEQILLHGTGISNQSAKLSRDLKNHGNKIAGGAYGMHLLGVICKKSNKLAEAVEYLSCSLKVNPFLWSSFKILCELGHKISADHYFDPIAAQKVVSRNVVAVTKAAATTDGRRPGTAPVNLERQHPVRLFVTPREQIDASATPMTDTKGIDGSTFVTPAAVIPDSKIASTGMSSVAEDMYETP